MDTKNQDEEFLIKCYKSTPFFLRSFFPNIFYRPFGKAHEEFFEVIDDPSIKKIVVTAWRGFGKSALFSFGLPAKAVLFQDARFIGYIEHNATRAGERSEALKIALCNSDKVKAFFGSIKPQDSSVPFSKESWTTQLGTRVTPFGRGQPVRGSTYLSRITGRMYRFDLILVDDLEDPKEVLSETQRDQLWTWIQSDVSNAFNLGEAGYGVEPDGYDNTNYRFIVIGTPLYQDSVIPRLQALAGKPGEGKEWTKLELKLCNDNRKSYWVEWMSDERVEALYQEHKNKNILDVFEREYRCQFVGPDTSRFKLEHMGYYHANPVEDTIERLKQANLWYPNVKVLQLSEEEISKDSDYFKFIQIDPASTSKEKSNYTASSALAAHIGSNRILVREILRDKHTPDELIDTGIRQCLRTKSGVLAAELTGIGDWGRHAIKNELNRRKLDHWIRFLELKSGNKKKEMRALMALSYFRNGLVYINIDYAHLLIPHLLLVPLNAEWDVIDSVVYFPQTLEEENQYMQVDFGPDETPDEIEAEYDELPEDDQDELDYTPLKGVHNECPV